MPATLNRVNFDFTGVRQKEILARLQKSNYQLLGYMGAIGAGQVQVGLPTWFTIPYDSITGNLQIDYVERYKVFVSIRSTIRPNSMLLMDMLSPEFSLGTSVVFDAAGNFTNVGSAMAGTIDLANKSDFHSAPATVGLAAKVNGEYRAFCAFSVPHRASVNMRPTNKVALFASNKKMVKGEFIANFLTAGCAIDFNDGINKYELEMSLGTYGIKSSFFSPPVDICSAKVSLDPVLNI